MSSMPGRMVYLEILKILKKHYDKDPTYLIPSSELRSKLNTPVEELRPYVEDLEFNGYVYREDGISKATFYLMISDKGIRALKERKIEITEECGLHCQ